MSSIPLLVIDCVAVNGLDAHPSAIALYETNICGEPCEIRVRRGEFGESVHLTLSQAADLALLARMVKGE